ncbi:Uridylate kinase [Mycoplasma haemocanis str. Illinois]|uniref:Uridylate kinase n=1 Tax=Mycoplasma haemocanis (strain Illinois) TaxID=1111676 RepID=H6N5N6_MYCHN|nr:UMP kinase [Mycoplasma haemocanis]AEW44996.1 Uridylate kinase [Mycoplasma haemocanis str. Illinois]
MARERILLKISGGNLKKSGDISFFNDDIFSNLMDQIEELVKEYDVALVVGGGNIWRGNSNTFSFLEESSAHHIGMLATLMNAIAIQNYLNKRGIKNRIYSAFSCPKIAEELNEENVKRSLDSGEVVIFGAGTGMPFVSTDTCAAIRAIEIGVSKLLVGKHNVKGVFDKDPHKHSDAKFLEKLSYEEILSMKLDVFDRTALALLAPRNVKICVFNQNTKDSFVKVLKGELEHTVIY